MLLKDKVAIVTVGANGMGEATSKNFSEEGTIVIIADYDFDSAQKVVDQIHTARGTARAYNKVDVTGRLSNR